MSYLNYIDVVQKYYVGYYQRPADPQTLRFWAEKLDQGEVTVSDMIEAFANSPESYFLYGDITSDNIEDVITAIYHTFFNRAPDAEGLQFYVDGFNNGTFTADTIIAHILDGASGDDLSILQNKIDAANIFTETLDPNLDLDPSNDMATYGGYKDAEAARDWLATVTDVVPTSEQVKDVIQVNIADKGDQIINVIASDDDLTTVLNPVHPGQEYYVDISHIISNDIDVDGDSLTVESVGTTVEGAEVTLYDSDNDGVNDQVKIVLPEDYNQDTFSFTYTVNDGHDHTDTATVSLAVSAVAENSAPDAQNDDLTSSIVITPGQEYYVDFSNLLSNDTDPDGDTLTIESVSTIVEGAQVDLYDSDNDGVNDQVKIVLPEDYNQDTFSFTYTVNDGHDHTDTATVSLAVSAVAGETINVTGAGEYTASSDVAETFVFQEGTYEYTIQGFDLNHDVLDLPDNPSPTLINDDFSDGEVTVQWAGNGQLIQVHLVGLPADQDASLLFASDLGSALA